MTEYEKKSLRLLALIASGINLQLAQATSADSRDAKLQHAKFVLDWSKNLNEFIAKDMPEISSQQGEQDGSARP